MIPARAIVWGNQLWAAPQSLSSESESFTKRGGEQLVSKFPEEGETLFQFY